MRTRKTQALLPASSAQAAARYVLDNVMLRGRGAPSWPPRAAPMTSHRTRRPSDAHTTPLRSAGRPRPAHHLLSAMMVLLAQLACSISDESPDARACAAPFQNVCPLAPRSGIAVRTVA